MLELNDAVKMFFNKLPACAKYVTEDDGSISCWTETGLETWAHGQNHGTARENLLSELKNIAGEVYDDLREGREKFDFLRIAYALKILTSDDEKLRAWLAPSRYVLDKEKYETEFEDYDHVFYDRVLEEGEYMRPKLYNHLLNRFIDDDE